MTIHQKIQGFYQDVLTAESLPNIPLVFCRVAKAGACVAYNTITKQPLSVQIDVNRCLDPEYAILHEIAHLKLGLSKGYYGHNAAFKKEESNLVDKYTYSSISFKHFMQ